MHNISVVECATVWQPRRN